MRSIAHAVRSLGLTLGTSVLGTRVLGTRVLGASLLGAGMLTTSALAQTPTRGSGTQSAAQPAVPVVKEAEPGLLQQATITPGVATRTALRQVTHGHVQDAEIEREHGRLVYSYDITRSGRSGVDEVLVDAKTGRVVSHTHESPAAERAEARQDARGARAARGTVRPD